MKISDKKIENSQAFLTIEMEPAEVEKSLDESYHRLVKKANIPGFRKGKAPRQMLERHIGKDSLLDDALNKLVPAAYEKAVKDEEIEAFARPHIEITQTDPLIFKATVPLPPKITLGDYHAMQVAPEKVKKVSKDEVASTIEQLRHQHAAWEPAQRPIDFNDLVVLDIESHIEDSPFINQKGVQYPVQQESSAPVTGFAEQLVGMKTEEEKEFKLQLPPDYPKEELAGKESAFKIRIVEIKQEMMPALNDKFAEEVNPDFKTLDSLQEEIKKALRLEAERKGKADFQERIVEAVVDMAQVEFPPILVEVEIERLIDQQLQRWQIGRDGLEEYLKRVDKTEKELREELTPLATKRIAHSLVLGRITEEEKIEASNSEIEAEIENMTMDNTQNRDEVKKYLNTPQSRGSIKQMLLTRKTLQRLVEIAGASAAKTKTKIRSKKGGEK